MYLVSGIGLVSQFRPTYINVHLPLESPGFIFNWHSSIIVTCENWIDTREGNCRFFNDKESKRCMNIGNFPLTSKDITSSFVVCLKSSYRVIYANEWKLWGCGLWMLIATVYRLQIAFIAWQIHWHLLFLSNLWATLKYVRGSKRDNWSILGHFTNLQVNLELLFFCLFKDVHDFTNLNFGN